MRYWNGNFISATEREPSSLSTSGIFDLRAHSIYANTSKWQVPGELVTDGLTFHLDAGDSSSYSGSGTTWSDLTSNNIDFTLTNGPVYNSGFGGYFTFDGSNDYAITSSAFNNFDENPFTIEIWHRSHTVANFEGILSNDSGAQNGTFQVDHYDGKLRLTATDSGAIEVIGSSATNLRNTWKQIVFVREGILADQFKVYLNGVLDVTGTQQADLHLNDNLQIGRNRGKNLYFDGDISIIRVYRNKALTATQVVSHFSLNRGRYSI